MHIQIQSYTKHITHMYLDLELFTNIQKGTKYATIYFCHSVSPSIFVRYIRDSRLIGNVIKTNRNFVNEVCILLIFKYTKEKWFSH